MSIKYSKVKKHTKTFQRLFGISVEQFQIILEKVEPQWQTEVLDAYKRPSRPYKLEIADMVLMLLLYYRSYITQMFIGYMFGIDAGRVCRIIQKLEPILAGIMTINKCKTLTPEEIETLICDATESPIERPKKRQKLYYSGKKKRHTLKTEIRITSKGRIVRVSKAYPGSTHDFTVLKQEGDLPKDSRLFVDSGYQGIHAIHPNVDFPYKATKERPLDDEEKAYNKGLSRCRIMIENVLGDIKVFKILSDRYRNKRKRYNIKFRIIAGIVNLKNGFAFL